MVGGSEYGVVSVARAELQERRVDIYTPSVVHHTCQLHGENLAEEGELLQSGYTRQLHAAVTCQALGGGYTRGPRMSGQADSCTAASRHGYGYTASPR